MSSIRLLRMAVVVGARPEFVKVAPLSRAISQHNSNDSVPPVEEMLIHTGQHYDDKMSAIFFRELGLDAPAHDLGVGSGTHGEQTGEIMRRLEKILMEKPPDVVVVFGDTNSTLAGALVAAKLHIPVAHIEAGLRSYNRRMPEEINRVLTDHVSQTLFCPSEAASRNLQSEGIEDGVHITGDINADALAWATPDDDFVGKVLADQGLERDRYAVATVHRAENTDSRDRLTHIMEALGRLGSLDMPVILPVHPRTAAVVGSVPTSGVQLVESVGHREMLALLAGAKLGLTDSGGLQKELYWLGVPCVTLRDETEWVETVEAGWNVVAGTSSEAIIAAARRLTSGPLPPRPQLYGDGKSAQRMLQILVDNLAPDLVTLS